MSTTLHSDRTGRHPVNTGHLVMGLVFAGLVGVWALIVGDVVSENDARWLLPVPWVAGGAIGLAVATLANMRSRRTEDVRAGDGQTVVLDEQDDEQTAVLDEQTAVLDEQDEQTAVLDDEPDPHHSNPTEENR